MIVTKNAAELCVLLTSEFYGQLPSRILSTLFSKGRSTVRQLAQVTSLSPQFVRHGLAVLIQQNLIFHHTVAAGDDPDITSYEANSDAAYNLVRTGKILTMIEQNYGEDARDLVQDMITMGHRKVGEMVQSHGNRKSKMTNGHSNGTSIKTDPCTCASDVVRRLIVAGILEPLTLTMSQTMDDIRSDIEEELMRDRPTVLRGKAKNDFDDEVKEAVKDIFRERKALKWELEAGNFGNSASGPTQNGNGYRNGHGNGHEDGLDPNIVLRLNYDKCLVELRNQKLAQYAEDSLGLISATVYSALLALLNKKISVCHAHRDDDSESLSSPPSVTTVEIYEQLASSVDVFKGIGKCDAEEIDIASAERIQANPPGTEIDENGRMMDEGADEKDHYDSITGYQPAKNPLSHTNGFDTKIVPSQNGSRETKVKFADRVPTKAERMQQMRQHLLVLAESRQNFVRHCGIRDQGEWTVDFAQLVAKLRVFELDTIIEGTFGRQGLRLTKILRAKGKLDDKVLPNIALMKKQDVHTKMAEMQMEGFLEVQEVPRDNNRSANRTLFLWFFDTERVLARIMDNSYKAMSRHLQRLEVERRKRKDVLAVAERQDVQGREEEKLRRDVYKQFLEFRGIETKLLAQIDRLDDVVGLIRDY